MTRRRPVLRVDSLRVPVGGGALLVGVGADTGVPAVINTSLNLRGQPMVLTPRDALELFDEARDNDCPVRTTRC
jgi:hypothetical protein